MEDAALESEAQQALQALQSGSNVADVILRCYVQMSRVLQKEQKLELKQTMTARPFERLLEARGFPAAPVHQLTGLFENVRYGYQVLLVSPDPVDFYPACFPLTRPPVWLPVSLRWSATWKLAGSPACGFPSLIGMSASRLPRWCALPSAITIT